jgi:hypothetical protein
VTPTTTPAPEASPGASNSSPEASIEQAEEGNLVQKLETSVAIAKGPGSGKTKNSFCVEKCILAKIANGETNSGAIYQKLEFTHPESDGTALVTNWHKSLMPLLALAHSKPGTTVWVHRIADESLVLDDVTFVCGVAYASGRKVEKL